MQSQSELLSGIPQPMCEALDPVASMAEPKNRDGKVLASRVKNSVMLDLIGPVGIAVGALSLALLGFNIAIPLLNLPPLMAPQQGRPPNQQGLSPNKQGLSPNKQERPSDKPTNSAKPKT
jgi:hypothetical protein